MINLKNENANLIVNFQIHNLLVINKYLNYKDLKKQIETIKGKEIKGILEIVKKNYEDLFAKEIKEIDTDLLIKKIETVDYVKLNNYIFYLYQNNKAELLMLFEKIKSIKADLFIVDLFDFDNEEKFEKD